MQNLSNKEIHVTLQNDNAKHRPLQFVSWLNFIGRFENLCPGIGGKVLTDKFIKYSDGYIFCLQIWPFFLPLNPAIYRRDSSPNILCPRP